MRISMLRFATCCALVVETLTAPVPHTSVHCAFTLQASRLAERAIGGAEFVRLSDTELR